MLLTIPTFIGISLLTFAIIQLSPGSPISLKLQAANSEVSADANTQKIIEDTKKLYGLDKPLLVQYGLWMKRLVFLDFGNSFKDQRPVLTKIREALPITLLLNIISLFLIYLISIPLGVFSATHPHTKIDMSVTIKLFLLYSIPNFWMAMILKLYLGGGKFLNWFPIYGTRSINADEWSLLWQGLDFAWHLVLPVFCLSYGSLAVISRYMRSGMLDVMNQDYIRTARAYGFSERVVVWRYAMRNSLIPIITLLGTLLPALIGGSIIIETIFSIPGMGMLTFQALLFRDYPVIMGTVTISALLTLAGLILSDILYVIVDPRIKLK